MTPRDQCAMSEACEGKDADHGLMCERHRAESDMIENTPAGNRQRTYVCRIGGCDKSFANQHDKNNHRQTKHGAKRQVDPYNRQQRKDAAHD